MPDKAYFDVRDNSREISRTSLNVLEVTAANFTAQGGLLTALVSSYDAISLGAMAGSGMQIITRGGLTPPADENAQIETGWLITYSDSQEFLDPGTDLVPNPGYGKAFQLTWPTADYTDHLVLNSDLADLTETDVAAFVAAFEEVVRSPYGGEITVISLAVANGN